MFNIPRKKMLFCLILDSPDSSFPVDIEDSRLVGHLKDAIFNKKSITFTDLEADELILWKVSGSSSTLTALCPLLPAQGSGPYQAFTQSLRTHSPTMR
jgi:hypothetical protein